MHPVDIVGQIRIPDVVAQVDIPVGEDELLDLEVDRAHKLGLLDASIVISVEIDRATRTA